MSRRSQLFADAPGALLHLDIKKLGRFRGPGHRRTGQRSAWKTGGKGWEFVHVCVDDHSRVAYVETLEDETKISVDGFVRRAVSWFEALGFAVHRILTDNGSGYRSHLVRSTCEALGIRHIFTRPYTPQTNGKAERFIQSMLRECIYGRTYRNSADRRRGLQKWTQHYNQTREHSSLGRKPPITRLVSTTS